MPTEYPLCPHCNIELHWDDDYDMSYSKESIILHQVGHCQKCERDYQWQKRARCTQWENVDLEEC